MLSHLLELRRRTVYILCWFGLCFLLFFFIANDLFHTLVQPLLLSIPNQSGLIATQIASPVFTPIKLAGHAAMLLTVPFALFHLWRFVSPGLYQREQQHIRGAIVLSILLFSAGVLFCFYIVLPFMFQFFAKALPPEVHYMPDMTYALDFITRMLMLFGLSFQVPLVCLILVRFRIIDVHTLKAIRPYVIVSAFIIGMLLTPPDVFSQITLAVPLCLLYELGIIFSLFLA